MNRPQKEAIMFAVRAAIVDASPMRDDGTIVLDLGAALSALAYIIAAIGVQAKFVDTPEKTKIFVDEIANAIEKDVATLRTSGEPFAPDFRGDQLQ
jgi:hypothetical protein